MASHLISGSLTLYRVPVFFEVSAEDAEGARELVEAALMAVDKWTPDDFSSEGVEIHHVGLGNLAEVEATEE